MALTKTVNSVLQIHQNATGVGGDFVHKFREPQSQYLQMKCLSSSFQMKTFRREYFKPTFRRTTMMLRHV